MHGFLGPGPRAGRGDIRAAILALLVEGPMHGYQIMRELSERTGGVWRPSPGSVYPTLQQLQDEALVSSVETESGRRTFELTEEGRRAAAELETPAPWETVADESESAGVELRDLVFQVIAAARQVVQAGDTSRGRPGKGRLAGRPATALPHPRRGQHHIGLTLTGERAIDGCTPPKNL